MMAELDSPTTIGMVYARLLPIAVSGLPRMFDAAKGLFCYREILGPHGLTHRGHSVRYTAIALIGLREAAQQGLDSPLDLNLIERSLIANLPASLGDLGLCLWATSLARSMSALSVLDAIASVVDHAEHGALETLDPTELSWLLVGLCHHIGAAPARDQHWIDLRDRTARALMGCLSPGTDLFSVLAPGTGGRLARRIRQRFSSFATSIYPIYALAVHAQQSGNTENLTAAVRVAQRLCALQTSDGSWPWMYDVRRGQVVDCYPVYSVHQDAMAPMALKKLSDCAGLRFDASIGLGLKWLFGHNAKCFMMVDTCRATIWRSLCYTRLLGFNCHLPVQAMQCLVLGRPVLPLAGRIRVWPECRPYHMGWLLLAGTLWT